MNVFVTHDSTCETFCWWAVDTRKKYLNSNCISQWLFFFSVPFFLDVSELVVAESVVVIKKLLQMQPEKHSDIIKHMAKLIDNIQVWESHFFMGMIYPNVLNNTLTVISYNKIFYNFILSL